MYVFNVQKYFINFILSDHTSKFCMLRPVKKLCKHTLYITLQLSVNYFKKCILPQELKYILQEYLHLKNIF